MAEIIVALHIVVVFLIIFGWYFETLHWLYFVALLLTAVSWLIYKRCILVDVEFYFRNKIGIYKEKNHGSFLTYYGYKLFKEQIPSDTFMLVSGWIFLVGQICLWIYRSL